MNEFTNIFIDEKVTVPLLFKKILDYAYLIMVFRWTKVLKCKTNIVKAKGGE